MNLWRVHCVSKIARKLYSVAAVINAYIFKQTHQSPRGNLCISYDFFNTPIIRLMPATVATVRLVRSTMVIKIPVTNLPQCQTSRFIHRSPVHAYRISAARQLCSSAAWTICKLLLCQKGTNIGLDENNNNKYWANLSSPVSVKTHLKGGLQ